MPNLEVINPNTHKTLRVTTAYSAELGHGLGSIMILPSEVVEAQREYPILFRKHPETGQFLMVAMLGFGQSENLFLADNAKWNANYIPLAFKRGPFMIGTASAEATDAQPMVCIDRADSRVNDVSGEVLFDESGAPSAYLESARRTLLNLHKGVEENRKMIDAFAGLNLIEPVSMEIEFADKSAINFSGAYTLNTDKLSQLDANSLVRLNTEGYLALAYFIAGSVGNVSKLIERKNALLARQ